MNKNKHHKAIWASCAVLHLLIAGGTANSQDRTQDRTQDRAADNWPARPVTLVVPYTPGTGADILARILGPRLGERWKQAVVTDNRAGASGNIGSDHVAKAAPDGHTLLFTATSVGTNPAINTLPFDPVKSFSPVIQVSSSTMSLSINPAVPARNLREFVELAKKQPGKLHYASPGSGGPQHLAMELFKRTAGIDMLHVPHKGAAEAVTSLISGQVDVMFVPIQSALPHIRSAKLRALGVSSPVRYATLPDTPTVAEALNAPGFEVDLWYGLFVPSQSPREAVQVLNREMREILVLDDVKAGLAAQGMVGAPSSPEDLRSLMLHDLARWAKVVAEAGIRAE